MRNNIAAKRKMKIFKKNFEDKSVISAAKFHSGFNKGGKITFMKLP